jgi:hypothetical protein
MSLPLQRRSNPGWGYRVEIQSDADSRYSSYTELSWENGRSHLDPWVTESGGTEAIHTDPSLSSSGWGDAVQCNVYGLKYGTLYNFRVRTWGQTDAGVDTYSSYSTSDSATTTTPSNIYYVSSTDGDNARAGTSWATAWRNLSYADDQVSAGDLVLVDGGSYASDGINAPVNGTAGTGRITFQVNYGETAVITSRSATQAILLDQNFWVLDGIDTTASASGGDPVVELSGSRNVLANVDIDGNGSTADVWGWVNVTGTYNLIHNSYLHDCCGNTNQDQQNATILDFEDDNADYNTVQYSRLSAGSHDTCYVRGDFNRILNNLSDGGLGMGAEFQLSANYNLYEGNEVKDVATNFATGVYKPGFEISAANNTARRNVVYDGWSGGTAGNNSRGIEVSYVLAAATNNLIYNNTVVHNGNTGIVFWNGDSNGVDNSIFYDNGIGTYEVCSEFLEDSASTGNDLQRNLFLDVTGGGSENPGASIISLNYGGCVTIAYADTNYSEFTSNYNDYSPNFIDYSLRSWNNLHLKSTSEVINLGRAVTDTVWGSITVNDTYPELGAFEWYEVSGGGSQTQGITGVGVTIQ